MTRFRSVIFSLLASTLLLNLTGCHQAAILNPQGVISASEKQILFIALGLMLLVVVPTIILSFFITFRYRASNIKAKYDPEWSHSTLLEVIWWIIPCIIIGILAVITWVSAHRLDPYKPLASETKPLTIQVIALDWKWLFIYPEQHIAAVNFVQFPVNVPVQFLITADAPMNSFQIPQLAGQIYAMSGMQTKLNLIANHMGDYRGASTNYSGAGFAYMNFIARASSQENFDQWVQKVQKSPQKLDWNVYKRLAKPSQNVLPTYYFSVADDLFKKVIMKYMMPMNAPPAIHPNARPSNAPPANPTYDYAVNRDYESRYNKNADLPAHHSISKG